MKKSIVLILIAIVAFSSQSLAWGGKARPTEKMKLGFTRELNLTEEQQKKFLEQRQQMEKELLPLEQKNEKIRGELGEEIKKEAPDRGKLHNLIKDTNKNMAEIQIRRMDYMLKMRELLTPEQKTKFKELAGKGRGRGRR
ncbi:hypothetical protein A2276_03360 [candidate division WOR-1 bacterium RIFOXYA12_FULL_43_27]|uniref:Periplasmic heavy metal sensor n=1 Tax=candidate division WOR-1 bacterium RIFOXYC2_FULL_46_14 TaxID=1802587 RepID=A0A1F4U7F4_UNCSA|nr:MAG: hypothetical protein A2276_03360 [candidate division WOR-1 bacterium RIFOXYA12_FULL_43_27]OGC19261.1 MAG: hypothetical protein A2292_00975 [candidate division WOR-1 bacterium RIFOXYB2_FULL_46_45]OGC30250.1 MAG: hypothetical protein A2232_00975 [candidate division WOR-1 bacterium RIFOXYA2_FULL_46_56]OGC40851.1 MAG: hypothetical protein A2438_00975 [candidate division WOR-1 bacterium RIFOXYC2_FULL_46_14]